VEAARPPHETARGSRSAPATASSTSSAAPTATAIVLPGVFPAASAIDWTLAAPLIGDRARPLATNTRERIRRGLERLPAEPFAIRLLQGGIAEAADAADRDADAAARPRDGDPDRRQHVRAHARQPRPRRGHAADATPCTATLDRALVVANRENGVPRDATASPRRRSHDGTARSAIVELQRNGDVRDAETEPAGTMRAGGFHHGVVVRNNTARGDQGQMSTPDARAVPDADGGVPSVARRAVRQSEPHAARGAGATITTRDRLALIVPPSTNGMPRDAHTRAVVRPGHRDAAVAARGARVGYSCGTACAWYSEGPSRSTRHVRPYAL
jgi:hypothetical protein